MLVLLPDRQITRRKRTHLVVNLEGDVQFAASRITDVLDWLDENNVEKVTVEVDTGSRYMIQVHRFINPLQELKPTDDKQAQASYDETSGDPPDRLT